MYQATPSGLIVRLADQATIPADPANRDYAAYQAWVADGNTPAVAPDLSETDQTWS